MAGTDGALFSLLSISEISVFGAVFILLPLTALPTVAVVAVRGLTAGTLAFLMSRSCRRPNEFAIEDNLLVDVTLGGLEVCDLVVRRTGSAICEGATAPDTVRLEGGPGGGAS